MLSFGEDVYVEKTKVQLRNKARSFQILVCTSSYPSWIPGFLSLSTSTPLLFLVSKSLLTHLHLGIGSPRQLRCSVSSAVSGRYGGNIALATGSLCQTCPGKHNSILQTQDTSSVHNRTLPIYHLCTTGYYRYIICAQQDTTDTSSVHIETHS